MANKINWDDLEWETVAPSIKRKMIWGEHTMIARLELKDGGLVPQHQHENEQLSFIESGTIRFWLGEDKSEVVDVHAGESLIIPPNVPHEALIIGDVVATDTFSPPRQDWIDGDDAYLRESLSP
ncbi:MAG: cupin domain-containing protein [Candidatus Marinimicrobia bacterium]|nr:cupin domain-containing protein [Candidatus Neomarinimicrobiota bacterium]